MAFVGREGEILRLIRALEAGRNVIVSGPYGMGRTALAQQAGKRLEAGRRFVFCDFSQPPSDVCEALARELFGRPSRRRSGARFLAVRGEILRRKPADPREHVLVLDDILRITHPQADLLRFLAERFRLVAIAEVFLPAPDRLRLESWLNPAERINLGRLSPSKARELFATVSARHGLDWEPARIASLARASGGYPLLMRELEQRELARHSGPEGASEPQP
jgi:MoxR-like ATPase